ncbi:MAG: TraR/DksA family transcriptional regulator [Planctomycetota bacterium]|jgi:RNA polymerase-binding protein DksA|nr:TraR/DksA family transcriptional regulator [Planctomycetota bacterium]
MTKPKLGKKSEEAEKAEGKGAALTSAGGKAPAPKAKAASPGPKPDKAGKEKPAPAKKKAPAGKKPEPAKPEASPAAALAAAAVAEPIPTPAPPPRMVLIKMSPAKKIRLSVAPEDRIVRSAAAKAEPRPAKSNRRLSGRKLGEIKTHLLEIRDKHLASMHRELAIQKERSESKVADDVDKATDAYDEELSFEIATTNDQMLKEIRAALEKIENGTYGECEVCGGVISPSRLLALPFTTTCVVCRGQEELALRREDNVSSFSLIAGDDAGEGDAEPQ